MLAYLVLMAPSWRKAAAAPRSARPGLRRGWRRREDRPNWKASATAMPRGGRSGRDEEVAFRKLRMASFDHAGGPAVERRPAHPLAGHIDGASPK
jgi:hypothetical protein